MLLSQRKLMTNLCIDGVYCLRNSMQRQSRQAGKQTKNGEEKPILQINPCLSL